LVSIFSWEAVSWKLPSKEIRRFEIMTGMPWPTEAKLVRAEHGLGFQDKRYLWVFEGESQAFLAVLADREWHRQSTEDEDLAFLRMAIQKMEAHFSGTDSWNPDEIYFWMADKEAQEGPFGPGYLISDKDHQRWCVWWDGI